MYSHFDLVVHTQYHRAQRLAEAERARLGRTAAAGNPGRRSALGRLLQALGEWRSGPARADRARRPTPATALGG